MNTFDFDRDIRKELHSAARSMGFKIPTKSSLDNTIIDYLTVRSKLIESKKRKVLINPLFRLEFDRHTKRKEIEHIINVAYTGGNLNPFQSKRLVQSNFHDHLLNEWRIHHFHLSLEQEKNSFFVKQVNALLFAYIDDEHIIFLGTDTHYEGVFGDVKWIEALHDFFPVVIKQYRDTKITSYYPKLDACERQSLWNKGYTLGMTEVRGVVYHNPGIGRSCTGHSMINLKTSGEIIRWIYKLKEQIEQSYELLCQHLNITACEAAFEVRLGETTFELYEQTSKELLLTFPNIFADRGELQTIINGSYQ